MSREEIIKALRCSSSSTSKCVGNKCPYYFEESEDNIKKFFGEHPDAKVPSDFFAGCDVDRIAGDAADALEEEAR